MCLVPILTRVRRSRLGPIARDAEEGAARRVLRGESFGYYEIALRAADRSDDIGFRVVSSRLRS